MPGPLDDRKRDHTLSGYPGTRWTRFRWRVRVRVRPPEFGGYVPVRGGYPAGVTPTILLYTWAKMRKAVVGGAATLTLIVNLPLRNDPYVDAVACAVRPSWMLCYINNRRAIHFFFLVKNPITCTGILSSRVSYQESLAESPRGGRRDRRSLRGRSRRV